MKKRSRELNLRVSLVAKDNLVSDSSPFLMEGIVNSSVMTDIFLDNRCLSICALYRAFVLDHALKRKQIELR